MKFLADECCSAVIIEVLRQAGHKVASVAEVMRGADDEAVLNAARKEGRILITEDKDFGDLVVFLRRVSQGVILVRSRAKAYKDTANLLCKLLERNPEKVAGHFVVVTPRQVRSQPIESV